MKHCDWCGQEYPDDATVCLVDGRPLPSLEIATTPLVAQPGERPASSGWSFVWERPVLVWFAGGLMIVSGVVGSLIMLFAAMRPEFRTRVGSLSAFVSLITFAGGILRVVCGVAIFYRRNWARWTFLGWTGLFVLLSAIRNGLTLHTCASLMFMAGIGSLLTLGAGDYFDRRTDQSTRPAPDPQAITSETRPSRSVPGSEIDPGSGSAP
jgi:hypothetical protein